MTFVESNDVAIDYYHVCTRVHINKYVRKGPEYIAKCKRLQKATFLSTNIKIAFSYFETSTILSETLGTYILLS